MTTGSGNPPSTVGPADARPEARFRARTLRRVVAGTLVLVWFAWPVLAYGGLITATPFMGELPTAQDQADASRLLILAGLSGLIAPALAWLLAGRGSSFRVAALLQLGVTLAAAVVLLFAASR
jgi:hypothetical protein